MTTLCLEDYTPPMTAPIIPIPEKNDRSPAVLGVAPALMTEVTATPQLAQPISLLTRFIRVLSGHRISKTRPVSAGFGDEG
jgi:hypothetical protein